MDKKYEIPECEEIIVRVENVILNDSNPVIDVPDIPGVDDPGQ